MSQLTRREEGAAALELLLTDISLTPNKPTQAPVAATIAAAMLPTPPSTSNSACPCNQEYLQYHQDTPSLLEHSSKVRESFGRTQCLSKLETREGVTNANVWAKRRNKLKPPRPPSETIIPANQDTPSLLKLSQTELMKEQDVQIGGKEMKK